jgi:hypothetical protein
MQPGTGTAAPAQTAFWWDLAAGGYDVASEMSARETSMDAGGRGPEMMMLAVCGEHCCR